MLALEIPQVPSRNPPLCSEKLVLAAYLEEAVALISHGMPEGTVGPCPFLLHSPPGKESRVLSLLPLFVLFCFISLLLSRFLDVDKMCRQQWFTKASVCTSCCPFPLRLAGHWQLQESGMAAQLPA